MVLSSPISLRVSSPNNKHYLTCGDVAMQIVWVLFVQVLRCPPLRFLIAENNIRSEITDTADINAIM